MKIILLGLPGVGKGAQGKFLADRFGVSHVSIGDVVRELVRGDSSLGREIRELWKSSPVWAPLADDLAITVAQESVRGLDGFVLDGFPRNVVQAKAIDFTPDVAIVLHASEDVCRARVLGRGRSGDNAEKFEARLAAERERLPELIAFLRSHLRLLDIDADRPPEKVEASILAELGLRAED
jgi:adenylate kinase